MAIEARPDESAQGDSGHLFGGLEGVRTECGDTVAFGQSESGKHVRDAARAVEQLSVGLCPAVTPHGDAVAVASSGIFDDCSKVHGAAPMTRPGDGWWVLQAHSVAV